MIYLSNCLHRVKKNDGKNYIFCLIQYSCETILIESFIAEKNERIWTYCEHSWKSMWKIKVLRLKNFSVWDWKIE